MPLALRLSLIHFKSRDLAFMEELLKRMEVAVEALMTVYFGRPGGTWSPATMEGLLHRVSALPKDTVYVTSVTGPSHLTLETVAVLKGRHVRGGAEDEPYLWPGVLGDNPDHVARIARISKDLGREVATVKEKQALLKILPR